MHLFHHVIEERSMDDFMHVLRGILYLFASLLVIVNGHEIQIKYVVAKYPKGTSRDIS